ncbi:MAG TPA: multidrug effflux MFS transporter [Candidatus Avimuribaculum pullicola]|nr:multidrug effflux MFS transporter [Candidatus Avimuribaculum pullicola]
MRYKIFLLILLGMLTAFGPFVTDMYLPALPTMTTYFDTSVSMVQLGLTFSMIGLAVGQLLIGPISDKVGRRRPLIASMVLFIVSTVACIFSPDVVFFTAMRLLQGIAGAGGIVISRSIATDEFSGHELLKMLAVIGAINGIAPIVAPVVGGVMLSVIDWRGIFLVLLVLGVVLLVGSIMLRESLPVERRSKSGVLGTFASFGVVARNRRFISYVLQQGFAQFILFANIASSPFIIQQHYGYSPLVFSVCFGVNAIAIGVASALSVKFRRPEDAVATSCAGMLVMSIVIAAVLMLGGSFWAYEISLFILMFTMGLTFTASTTLALNSERERAGAASAMLGAVCFLSGGIVSPLVGVGDMLCATGIIFVAGAVLSSIFAYRARNTV